MTTMTDLEAPEARDVRRLAEDLDIPTQAFIDGELRRRRERRDVRLRQPRSTGEMLAKVAACDSAGRRPRGSRRPRGVRVGRLVAPRPEEAQEGAAAPRRARSRSTPTSSRCSRRSTWASRSATHARRRAARGREHRVLRRGDRQGLRRGRADRPDVERRHDPARAARRRRRRRAVELPAPDGDVEGRPGARDRATASS